MQQCKRRLIDAEITKLKAIEPQLLNEYTPFYHGTSKTKADIIKKEGLQCDHLGYETMEFHPSSKVDGLKRNLRFTDMKGNDRKNYGLFKSPSTGLVLNADVNGALGIIRKGCYELGLDDHPIIDKWKTNKSMISQPITVDFFN